MKGIAKWLKQNTPVILSVIGAAGVAVTAVTAVKGTAKASKLIEKAEEEKGEPLEKTEKLIAAIPAYVPTIVAGASTMICILSAAALNKRQQATIMGAYTLINSSYKEYKTKLKELYGEEVHHDIMESIAKEQRSDVHITTDSIFGISTLDFGDIEEPEITRTFYDCMSKRYFESTISNVIQAEYHLNRNFLLGGTISLNEFYEFLGLDKTDDGDELGWSNCNGDIFWIDFDHHKMTLDDGMEVFIIEMVFEPTAAWLEDV